MRPWFAVSLALLATLPASAQARETLSLHQALELARKQSLDLTAARDRLAQAHVGIEQAINALLPTLAAQGKYTHNYKGAQLNLTAFTEPTLVLAQTLAQANQAAPPSAQNPALGPALNGFENTLNTNVAGKPTSIVIQKEEQLDGTLNLTVPLVAPASYVSLGAAKSTYASQEANFHVTETSVLFQVAQAFYAAAGADEVQKARAHGVELSTRTVEITAARLRAGTVKKTDLNQAKLALLRAQQALREAQDLQQQTYRNLRTLLVFNEPFEVEPAPMTAVTGSAESLAEHALSARPELAAYRASVRASGQQVEVQDWRWAPTLTGFGQARLSNYVGFTGDNYAWALGVQLDWVLYDASSRETQRHLAQAQRREAEAQLAATQNAIQADIRNALDAVNTKRSALLTAQESSALAAETLALARAEYEAGTATQLDVLQAQDSLVNAEVQTAQARFDLALAKLTLDRDAALFPESEP
jgi:outer membrane protein TolC